MVAFIFFDDREVIMFLFVIDKVIINLFVYLKEKEKMKGRQDLIKITMFSTLLLVLLYAVFFMWLDIPISTWMQQAFAKTALFSVCYYINKFFRPEMWVVLAIIVALIGYFSKAKKQQKSYYLFSGSIILAYIVCAILKFVFGRYRPIEYFNNHLYGFHFFSFSHNMTSTPSGAGTMAFAGLFALATIFNKRYMTIILLLLATLIGIARIIILDHYVSDILFGAYVGILAVLWTQKRLKIN